MKRADHHRGHGKAGGALVAVFKDDQHSDIRFRRASTLFYKLDLEPVECRFSISNAAYLDCTLEMRQPMGTLCRERAAK
jgi:hypothetical protein